MKRLAFLGVAWLSTVAHAQSGPAVAALLPMPPAAQNVAIAIDASARISAPVEIGGRTWHFLIDTASTRSVISSDVADSLNLAKGNALQILTITGLDSVPSVIIPRLGFSTFAANDIAAPSLARTDLGGDGLLGLDILRNNRVSIDFRGATTLTIAPSWQNAKPKHSNAEPDTIVVTARSRMGELIVTDADIDGVQVAVILDTGSEDSIGNPALARMLLRSSERSPLGPATLTSVTGHTLPADYALIGKLQIGGVGIANVPMAFSDVATFRQFNLIRRPAILLGMQTLRLFARVTIDFPKRQIRFLLRRDALERPALLNIAAL